MGKYGGIFNDKQKPKIEKVSKVSSVGEETSKPQKDSLPNGSDKSRRGRPAGTVGGKRSNSAFKQSIAYVQRETHKAVMRRITAENDALPDDAPKQDFSGLIQTLLEGWLKNE